MTKMIKKLWTLFEKTQGFSQTERKTESLRLPLISNTPLTAADTFPSVSITTVIVFLRPYLPLILVVFVYLFSFTLILFVVNLAKFFTLLFLSMIIACGIRHLAQCFWSLSLSEIGFDSDFYTINSLGKKNCYTLHTPTIVTPCIVVLNFHKLDLPKTFKSQAAELKGVERCAEVKCSDSKFFAVPPLLLEKALVCLRNGFTKSHYKRSKSLVITPCSMSAEDFRRLRIYLLAFVEI